MRTDLCLDPSRKFPDEVFNYLFSAVEISKGVKVDERFVDGPSSEILFTWKIVYADVFLAR